MASPAAVLQVFVNANTKVASAQLAAFDRQLTGVGKTSAATGASMGKMTKGAAAAGLGIAAVGAAAIVAGKQLYDLGKQFDEAYDTIRIRTGATGRDLKSLENSFKGVAANVPNDFKEVGIAIGDLNTRLGLTGKPLERMAENVLHLSQLTGDDLEGNIKAVARSFVDWEVAIPKQTKYLDGMFRVSQASGASIADLSEQVQRFGSPLRQLGFDFEEAVSMFASFERAGVNTQTMVPGLKLAISNLTRPTENLAAQMAKLGIEAGKPDVALRQIFKLLGSGSTLTQIEKTGLAMDVFGKRAGADMAEAIKQGRFELDRFLKIFRDEQGDSIQKAAKDTYDFSENMRIFGNRLKVVVEPAATAVFKVLGRISQILASPFVARALKTMGRVFKATFDGIAMAVRPMVKGVRGGFKVISDVARAAVKVFRGIVNPIKSALSAVVESVRDRFRKAQIAAVNFVNGIIKIINKIPGVDIGTISLGSGEGSSQRGRAAGLQRGGFLMGGKPSGDSIPAMLERGEYVLNREAVSKVGVQRLNQLNFENAPRFQKGGRVGMITGGDVVDAARAGVGLGKKALDLVAQGPGAFIDLLPKANLPQPIKGLGPWLIKQVSGFIKNKVGNLLASASGGVPGYTGPPPDFKQLGNNSWVDSNTLAVGYYLANKFGVRITDGWRPQNASYGAINSSHKRGSPGNPGALDFAPPSTALQRFAGKHIAGLTENDIHDWGTGLHNHIAFFQRGGLVGMQQGGAVRKMQKGGWVKTGYTVFDDVMGYRGPISGPAYAELGAPNGGVGHISRLLGINKELPKEFPLDVKIGSKQARLFKRDIGYGQGDRYHTIDIWQSMWPFFGLNANSKGDAMIKQPPSKKEIARIRKAANKVRAKIAKARRKGGVAGFLDAAQNNVKKAFGFIKEENLDPARKRLAKARRQIRKAMKGKKPGGGGSGGGGGSTTPDGLPSGLPDLRRLISFLEEEVELMEQRFGTDWSAGGSDIDPVNWDEAGIPGGSERSQLIGKNQELLAALETLRDKVQGSKTAWEKRVAALKAKVFDARKKIENFRKKIEKARKQIKDLQKKIKGSKDQKKIQGWQEEIKGHKDKIGEWQKGIKNNQNKIKGWNDKIKTGESEISDLFGELDDLQGITGQGGKIQAVKFVLETLGYQAPAEPSDTGTDSELADLLRQQLQETQRALAISEAQMPIFQQFMPRFHQGGIVQGPMGAERPVMAQAGEGVFTRDQMRAMGSQNVTVVIEDAAIDSNRIRVEVDGVIQDKVSTVRRQGSNRKFVTSR